jgi:hypothetical protein
MDKKKNEPQMDQPSHKAMAGKLQIYADRFLGGALPRFLRR